MLTFAQRRENLTRLSADARMSREVTSVAAAAVKLSFGAVECGRGETPSEHIVIAKVDGQNVRREQVVGVQWVLTNNRGALAEMV